MIIEAKLWVDDSGEDILSFSLDPEIHVRLTDVQGVNDLKDLFVEILSNLILGDVSVELQDSSEYENQMYKEICEEYIIELNKDIAEARKNLILEGLIEEVDE